MSSTDSHLDMSWSAVSEIQATCQGPDDNGGHGADGWEVVPGERRESLPELISLWF